MGQKINPNGMRIGINKGWEAKWYANKKDFAKFIKEDDVIRKFIKKTYFQDAISHVVIERNTGMLIVEIFTGRPGSLIGKAGAGVEVIKEQILKLIDNTQQLEVKIQEVDRPDMDAQLVAENIAGQLEKRIGFRKAMRQCMGRAMRSGAKGIKTMVSGRLDGAEIARCEHYHEGSIPLHTLRADIDYATARANTTFGVIGVKVWIYKGEVLRKKKTQPKQDMGGTL